jgi:hypothetical protein
MAEGRVGRDDAVEAAWSVYGLDGHDLHPGYASEPGVHCNIDQD